MAAGSWFDWTTGDLVTEAKFQDIQDSILFIYASDAAANSALTNKVEGTVYFNTTDDILKVWDGSAWIEVGAGVDAFAVQYVIVGGGGSGGSVFGATIMGAGGAGAGGYVSSVVGENSGGGLSSQQVMYVSPSTNYPVSIGAGGTADSSGSKQNNGYCGNASYFNNIVANGGGAAGSYGYNQATGQELKGASGGGKGTRINVSFSSNQGGDGLDGQGYQGGASSGTYNGSTGATGGGGGASAAGSNSTSTVGGNGGDGVQTSITGTPTYYAGGGGGTGNGTPAGSGGQGGGADGTRNAAGNSGTANTGGGAGGIIVFGTGQLYGGNGGSGIVILLYPDTYSISQTGLTLTETDRGDGYKYATITAGTGTVSWS